MRKRGLNLPKKRSIIAPASLLKRFASYFIDLFIVNLVILTPLKKLLAKIVPADLSIAEMQNFLTTNIDARNLLFTTAIFSGLLTVAYFTYFEYKTQQTPGKMLMKNYITPVKGKTLSFWNYLLSNLTFLPFFPFILLWIVDPIYMFFSPKNQRFMEKISNIVVMEKHEVY